MQEEVNQRTVSFCIRGAKVTAKVLKDVLRSAMRKADDVAADIQDRVDEHADRRAVESHGKRKLSDLQNEGVELTNVEITKDNIQSFEKVARKYNVDYSLMADKAAQEPTCYVFFRARDASVMEAAFKEYTADTTREKASVRQKLHQKQKNKSHQKQQERQKVKTRSTSR